LIVVAASAWSSDFTSDLISCRRLHSTNPNPEIIIGLNQDLTLSRLFAIV